MPRITTTELILEKETLLGEGRSRIEQFCEANSINMPEVTNFPKSVWQFDACAYYRPRFGIRICIDKCAKVATEAQARNWNWPGSKVDRTPFGVVAHELGHHVDCLRSPDHATQGGYWGQYSVDMRKESGEAKLTNYCPNDGEWFAEMFRLFVTNSALLYQLRPRTWRLLNESWESVSDEDPQIELNRLKAVPERIFSSLKSHFVSSTVSESEEGDYSVPSSLKSLTSE